MRSVGVKVLKNRLSEYIRIAAQGETVYVTNRDRVVIELRPPAEGPGWPIADAALARMIRDGIVTPPRHPPHRPARAPAVAPLKVILEELEADRADR